MSVAVIADCHIGGPGGGPQPLIDQLDGLETSRCGRLILLGDVFHVWVGARQYETPEVRQVLESIQRLRRRGVRVDYIEGNRDFFIGAGPYAAEFDSVGDELAIAAAGRRFLAVHGDGLDANDRKYRFWRALSKNRVARSVAFALPAAWTRPFIHGTERRLAGSNFRHKIRIPEEVILEFAERRLGEGHDVLLLGHFHQSRQWQVRSGEVWLLEAWYQAQKIHWLGKEEGPAAPASSI